MCVYLYVIQHHLKIAASTCEVARSDISELLSDLSSHCHYLALIDVEFKMHHRNMYFLMVHSKWDSGHSDFCHLLPALWHKLLIILIILVFSGPSKVNISWLCAFPTL